MNVNNINLSYEKFNMLNYDLENVLPLIRPCHMNNFSGSMLHFKGKTRLEDFSKNNTSIKLAERLRQLLSYGHALRKPKAVNICSSYTV